MAEMRGIAGYPGYWVDSDGFVWSDCRPFGRGKGERKPMRQTRRTDGYMVVGIRPPGERKSGGKVRVLYVHRLVLEAFVGPCPEGKECCHRDGNKSDNRLDNLRWDTRVENSADADRHGRRSKGSSHGNAKLTEERILLARELLGRGFNFQKIADLFDVSRDVLWRAVRGYSWKHVRPGGNS